jgi:hypothetical protein
MPAKVLRFGVRGREQGHATAWKLWTEGTHDVYLACCALGGRLKAGLHESGRWEVAFSRGTLDADPPGAIPDRQDGLLDTCVQPPEMAPGVRLAVRILTPSSSARLPIDHSQERVAWIPGAPLGRATEIDIVFTPARMRVVRWPGARSRGTSLIGRLVRPDGAWVWAVHRVVALPGQSSIAAGLGQFFKGRSKAEAKAEARRELVFETEPDGSRVIYDHAVDVGD